MATKKKEAPFVQFSKKLITAVMIFWGVIRLWSVVALWLTPDVGTSMTAIVRGIDDIAMVNVLAYTGNSVSEKIALGYFEMRAKESKKENNEEDEGESCG